MNHPAGLLRLFNFHLQRIAGYQRKTGVVPDSVRRSPAACNFLPSCDQWQQDCRYRATPDNEEVSENRNAHSDRQQPSQPDGDRYEQGDSSDDLAEGNTLAKMPPTRFLDAGSGFADEAFIRAQRVPNDGFQPFHGSFSRLHAELLDARHHQAHVVSQPGP